MPKLINMSDRTVGRLKVSKNTKIVNKRVFWGCKCTCGNILFVDGKRLRNGETKSCGCLRIEITKRRVTTHGHTRNGKHTRTFTIWMNMLNRCMNPKNIGWRTYGGAGITVCEEWKDFKNFLYDMGESNGKLQLDRINNLKGYSKDNCRWVTSKQNNNNRKNNRIIEWNKERKTIAQWSENTGINYFKLYRRLIRKNWDTERALLTP